MKGYWIPKGEYRQYRACTGKYIVDTIAFGGETWDGAKHTAQTVVLRQLKIGIKSERVSTVYYTYPTEEELIAGHQQVVEGVREQVRMEMEVLKRARFGVDKVQGSRSPTATRQVDE